jgi:hypothetical protein
MSVLKVLMFIGLTMTTLAAPAWGQYESKGQGRTGSYSFSYTPNDVDPIYTYNGRYAQKYIPFNDFGTDRCRHQSEPVRIF